MPTSADPLFNELIAAIQAHQGKSSGHFNVGSYLGTNDHLYLVSTPQMRLIAREFMKRHSELDTTACIALLDRLAKGKSIEEKTILSKLIERKKDLLKAITPKDVDRWLSTLYGWCEVDSLCQNTFGPDELLTDWSGWKRQLDEFAKSNNINKRRASLVLLRKAVSKSNDQRLRDQAFETIALLEKEREILITKAVSWLLRSLITHHRSELETFLEEHGSTLPAIALRETRRKLVTGKK